MDYKIENDEKFLSNFKKKKKKRETYIRFHKSQKLNQIDNVTNQQDRYKEIKF